MLTSKAKGIENLKEKLIDLRNAKTMADEKMKRYNFKHYANFEICEALEVVSYNKGIPPHGPGHTPSMDESYSFHLPT